jgi:hypothetical protein
VHRNICLTIQILSLKELIFRLLFVSVAAGAAIQRARSNAGRDAHPNAAIGWRQRARIEKMNRQDTAIPIGEHGVKTALRKMKKP